MPTASAPAGLESIDAVGGALDSAGYIATKAISTAVYLAHHLRKPVLIEGPAGVGKTELAVCAAQALGFALLRSQCYEGLDYARALYERKYGKPLLYTQIRKEKIGLLVDDADSSQGAFAKLARFRICFSRDFLEPRPLLRAMAQKAGSVFLIDEIDKSEESFEALLAQLVAFVQGLRSENIRKPPSIAESVDWARTLLLLHAPALDENLARDTLNVPPKRESDILELHRALPRLTRAALEAPVAAQGIG